MRGAGEVFFSLQFRSGHDTLNASARTAIGISDNIILENNDTFLLDFAPGRENRVERVKGPGDIELDAGNLAVLLGGCRGTDSIAMTPDIRVASPQMNAGGTELAQVFYRKPCHVLDLF
ncbi:MAG: hypothetical protein HFH92_07610 [Lachnospiraceae bacterium]|uniref:sterol carrier protein domain-containing protein n=1 Tax=uncultured Acetatifactor sp. TaxID=1671927 RepID=UPI0026236E7C|nr:sterol carrier protein domain-containing protein [uncultured Acetatifactor sp.]MCI8788958.1 hypothetical protein [Lachnospiraceae bacterium]